MAGSKLLIRTSLLIFLSYIAPVFMTYVDYDIVSDRVCAGLGKRELSISLTHPLLVREGGRLLSKWPGTNSFSCRWEVEAKGRGLGVVAVVQKLKFRRFSNECLDYIKFKEDRMTEAWRPLCGTILFGMFVDRDLNLPPPPSTPLPPTPPTTMRTAVSVLTSFFKGSHNPWQRLVTDGAAVDPRGELKTYVYVLNKALKAGSTLELLIAYSGFQECDGSKIPSTLFHCGYGLCISRFLVNDGVVNCPFGDCIDEGSCSDAKASNITAKILGYPTTYRDEGGIPPGVTATSSVFAIAVLVTIGACLCFILRRNRQRRQESAGVVAYPPSNGGNGDYMGVPMSAVGQASGQQGDPLAPKPSVGPGVPVAQPGSQPYHPQPVPPTGSAGPPIGFTVPGTAYPGNIGTPYPYPGTGAPYPVQPAPSAAVQGGGVPSAPSQEPPPPYSSLFPGQ